MSRVSVITGGAGGMGVATAKILGRDHTLVLADVRQDRLDDAAGTLEALGISATLVNCDVTDRAAVEQLFRTAVELGDIVSVIHTAGVSPSMGDAEYVMTTNALGTLNVNEVFFAVAPEGAELLAVCDIAGAEMRSGLAYSVSKAFVRWYSTSQAERFNSRGLRIASMRERARLAAETA
jgi:NAD(P)-dependent dehydrogenase (short-subunit alcohol dehydrogenase family)